MRYAELQASIKAKQSRVETHDAEEEHRSRIVDQMKSQHQQFHMDQTQQTFDLSKQVMTLDERILEVTKAIATTQDEYKVHRKHILDSEEKIKNLQEQIMSCQVQIEILKGKPGEDTNVTDASIGKISLMPDDDFIPTAQISPKWQPSGAEEEISRLGHEIDLTNSVRTSRPSKLLDLASCHLESLIPQEDVDRIKRVLSPSRELPSPKGTAPAEHHGDGSVHSHLQSPEKTKRGSSTQRASRNSDTQGASVASASP